MGTILDETFQDIIRNKEIRDICIESVRLTSPFSMVRLSCGSIGTAANYYVQTPGTSFSYAGMRRLRMVEQKLMEQVRHDPLLIDSVIRKEKDNLLHQTLKVSILSALSQSLMNPGFMDSRGIAMKTARDEHDDVLDAPFSLVSRGDTVSYIGFEDNIGKFGSKDVKRIYVSDYYIDRLDLFRDKVRRLKKDNPDLYRKVQFSDGSENREILSRSDFVVITASAFCNNTMDSLLSYAKDSRVVLVEGPSGSLLPLSLFRNNVSHLITIMKNHDNDGELVNEDNATRTIFYRR